MQFISQKNKEIFGAYFKKIVSLSRFLRKAPKVWTMV